MQKVKWGRQSGLSSGTFKTDSTEEVAGADPQCPPTLTQLLPSSTLYSPKIATLLNTKLPKAAPAPPKLQAFLGWRS